MATIKREVRVSASEAWDATRGFGNPRVHLFHGAFTDGHVEENGAQRVVTFAMGLVVRERLVTYDDAARRLCYVSEGGRLAHHNGVLWRVSFGRSTYHDALRGPARAWWRRGVGRSARSRPSPSDPIPHA